MLENYENFSADELAVLALYVTNTDRSVFALKNLPEVIKGALFSRYSRSRLGLRSLLLKEFVTNQEETGFSPGETAQDQMLAIQKAHNFYDRILDGYGDDSIGELGGAHLAIENISMLAAKAIQDCRLGGSPLEKSTRYIPFDEKVEGQYLYYREPTLLASKHKELYLATSDYLFDTYNALIPPVTEYMATQFPQDPDIPTGAYKAALRAKVLDSLRGLLPASTLTNMGLFGNGRFFEGLIHKMHTHTLGELQEIGLQTFEELNKVIPSFVRRSDINHRTHQSYSCYFERMEKRLTEEVEKRSLPKDQTTGLNIALIKSDPACLKEVAAALLYEKSNTSFEAIRTYLEEHPEEIDSLLDMAAEPREMRRHKSPRALEHASFTFELLADFGAFRDMHRHRILTQARQKLTTDYGYYLPDALVNTPFEATYKQAMERAQKAFEVIRQELPIEAQYIVPMGYHIRWYFHVNLRSLQWLTELRSTAAGHPSYRFMAQEMARQVTDRFPAFAPFFKFVDYEGHDLGRMDQEKRREAKSLAAR